MAYALKKHRIHVKFDKIHRCIRDYTLALGRCMGGLFLKAQLHSSYIWGLNYRPFGTGQFHDQKKDIWRDFFKQKAWRVHCGKNFDNSLLSTIKKILLTMNARA